MDNPKASGTGFTVTYQTAAPEDTDQDHRDTVDLFSTDDLFALPYSVIGADLTD